MKADAEKITLLLKTARGQLDGIMKMVAEDQYCMDIANQLLSVCAILRKANHEIVKRHMEGCVKDALLAESDADAERKIEELVDLMERMSK